MQFEGFPLIIGWELTLACNLRCRHCASCAGVPRPAELTLDECLAICDQFPALLVQEVDFTGGEPLLNPNWPRIAGRLRDLGIPARMVTNGVNLTHGTIALMKDSGLAGVGVSLDGLEQTHDYVRCLPGMFERVVEGLGRLVTADLQPTVITAVNALSLPELPRIHELLRSIGVRAWQLQPIFPSGRSLDASDLHLTPGQYMELGRFVAEWGPRSVGCRPEIRPADSCGYFTELAFGPEWCGCSAGIAACGIMSDGRVKGCLSMPDDLVEGSLREQDLWDIWFRPGAFSYTRDFPESGCAALGPNCEGCEHGLQCAGGCSSMSYTTTGRFHNTPYCFAGIRRRAGDAVAVGS